MEGSVPAAALDYVRAQAAGSVALLLSGGVDSAVALHVLAEAGVKPDCYYIRIGPEDNGEWGCTAEEDIEMAGVVAAKYGCKLDVVDCHRDYWDRVAAYTMEKVRAGLTPNPDVMCNRLVKFGAFHDKVGHSYGTIATGHYAATVVENGRKWLATSPDPVKDQTDFLAQLQGWQLEKALFPIGGMLKGEVRAVAARERLVNAKRKDSQGICFLGKVNYNDYVRKYLGENPGPAVELETGKVVGSHRGLWFHTIGQRHGLGFGGGPWFVVGKDVAANTLYISKGYSPQAAYKSGFDVGGFNFLTEEVPLSRVCFKIRHTPEFHSGTAEKTAPGSFRVVSDEPIHGVAPGQFCTIYDTAHRLCIGSGEITGPIGLTPARA